jgi:hypothetical protein
MKHDREAGGDPPNRETDGDRNDLRSSLEAPIGSAGITDGWQRKQSDKQAGYFFAFTRIVLFFEYIRMGVRMYRKSMQHIGGRALKPDTPGAGHLIRRNPVHESLKFLYVPTGSVDDPEINACRIGLANPASKSFQPLPEEAIGKANEQQQ